MSWNDKNLYYDPEHFGLTVIGELNDPEASWSFDTFVVWKHEETGTIYWARDSGCSCPSPFDIYTSLGTATKVISMHDFIDAVKEYFDSVAPYSGNYESRETWETSSHEKNSFNTLKADALELIRLVRET